MDINTPVLYPPLVVFSFIFRQQSSKSFLPILSYPILSSFNKTKTKWINSPASLPSSFRTRVETRTAIAITITITTTTITTLTVETTAAITTTSTTATTIATLTVETTVAITTTSTTAAVTAKITLTGVRHLNPPQLGEKQQKKKLTRIKI